MAPAVRSRDVGRGRHRQQARGAVEDVPGMWGTTASANPRLSDEERIDWLRLIRSENVGPRTFGTLLRYYGSARSALKALPGLARRGGAKHAARIAAREEAERELAAMRSFGVRLVALGEPEYPRSLARIDDAPPLIAVHGNAALLDRPMVAIVGSRNASAAGAKMAGRLARDLGQAGFAIVSGLARGIDRIYPPEHADLLDSILVDGVALSEMPLGWEPRARDFPRRNRLISGLALGLVVVEAARRSGSLITVRFALEQGREVFAVPGSPLDPRAEGTNGLLKQGATLVTEASDVIAVLEPILGRKIEPPAEEPLPAPEPEILPDTEARTRILALLGPTPVALDDLVRLAEAPPAVVRTVLLELELAGRVERHRDGSVSTA